MTVPATAASRTAARALVDALEIHGVDTVFCVPGESYLAVLDALHDSSNAIRTITCRQEGGAAFMAEAWGKETEVDPREEGKYEGRSLESLKAEYEKLKAGGPYKEGSRNFGKMKDDLDVPAFLRKQMD